ncbi:MAG: asparagine synthase (glutamine-hydrolyzing) [Candidatus Magasanikbacteria bacterium]|nr:asparagine synthase (glutamine-hydrolyzing) [Candidatus Magasanikbacteria bacterium]
MCGIVGVIQNKQKIDKNLFAKMLLAVRHRGPESDGTWMNQSETVALGHRRLAIIDLSPGGHQPKLSRDSRFIITFNGEIYNYEQIKNELIGLGWSFNTQSDTEVLLNAYIQWKEKCLDKLNGMFAFAIWDNQEQTLFAARDRLGEKPFKYYADQEKFIFASELKSILIDPSVAREPDWQAVDLAMTYRFVPAPQTGFKHIKKLPAGHYLIWRQGNISVTPYWQAFDYAKENKNKSLEEWKKDIWDIFKDSIKGRMISDVPVGAFLSGGLDSSSVVAAMAEVSTSSIKTFSVGLKDQAQSELSFAKLVADRFKTDHTEIIIEPNVVENLPALVHQFEEPFFDNAALPTMIMAKETKKHVTVVLTGDGADECFGGYPNHSFLRNLKNYQSLPGVVYKKIIPQAAKLLAATGQLSLQKLFYRAEVLSHSLEQAYVDYYAIWKKELKQSHFYLTKDDLYSDELKEQIDFDLSEKLMRQWWGEGRVSHYGTMNKAMLADIVGRLGDNYLLKVDFASMISALENRAPFLDHRLVELALSLPEQYKVRNGQVKWIWKEIVKDKIPTEIIARRKIGFGIPIGSWMRNELYSYVYDSLIVSDSLLYKYFNKNCIIKLLEDHKKGRADYSNHLWCLLLLKQWLQTFFAYDKQ